MWLALTRNDDEVIYVNMDRVIDFTTGKGVTVLFYGGEDIQYVKETPVQIFNMIHEQKNLYTKTVTCP